MTAYDYLLTAALLLVVVRQIRGRRLSGAALYVPIAVTAYAAFQYLHTIPTSGNDLVVVVAGAGIGLALGALCGVFTLVYPDRDGVPFARATGPAAALWVAGIGSRVVFSLWAQHGGGAALARFTVAHALSPAAWVTGFVLMAILEAAARTAVLLVRARRLAAPSAGAIMQMS
jgi:hypothetical protein